MGWEPILLYRRNEVENKLKDIASILEKVKVSDPSLFTGRAGIALFFFYYFRFTKEVKYYSLGKQILIDLVNQVNKEHFSYAPLCSGLCGIAWLIEHLNKNHFIIIDVDKAVSEIDLHISKNAIYEMSQGNYDFLHGAIGIGTYLFHKKDVRRYEKILKIILEKLSEHAINQQYGIAWKASAIITSQDSKSEYNLSLSHGISSIIIFLCNYLKFNIATKHVSYLLNQAVSYLMYSQIEKSKNCSLFPSSAGENMSSRLGWCYGDLGIGWALFKYSQLMKDEEKKYFAIQVFKHASTRREYKSSAINDAEFCHGASGVAHFFNRIYHVTSEAIFKETSSFWYDMTLKMAIDYSGISVFHTWDGDKWKEDYAFLEGITGIGLSLLASVTSIDPRWDEFVLLS